MISRVSIYASKRPIERALHGKAHSAAPAIQVTMTDCEHELIQDNCRVVGQEQQSALVKVPPGQTRTFSTYAIKFNNLPKRVYDLSLP